MANIRNLKGIGEAKAKLFAALDIDTVSDLLHYYPRTYSDRRKNAPLSSFKNIEDICAPFKVLSAQGIKARALDIFKVMLEGEDKQIYEAVWFKKRTFKFDSLLPLRQDFKIGSWFWIVGHRENKNSFTDRKIVVEEYYPLESPDLKYNVDALIPLYSLTKGLTQKFLRTCQANALQNYLVDEEEVLPLDLLKKRGLLQAKQAIKAIHFPVSMAELENARRRLIYEEFLLMTLAFNLKARQKFISQKPYKYTLTKKYLTPFKNNLGFSFTPSQIKVINEIFKDMMSPTPMTRLIQGDVGSGKTVVAISALLLAVESGKQGAFMAPTEILATQHFITLNKYLKPLGVNTALLTSKTTAKERQTLLDKLANGEIQILIGTHALIEDKVKFKDLSLVIVDEQHRFGVKQRAKLRQKSANVDMLSMTATPIPRTFALAFYGDLDVSTISELPKGRQEIKTFHTSETEAFLKAEEAVLRGEQVYIVYPLIDESDKLELKAVTAEFEAAKKRFPKFNLGLIHGAMKPKEKQKIMEDFLAKKIDILFATPVIEVGIDVKNATVMIIENAERFGLASLHQLRGRIGRGKKASTCYLVTKNLSTISKERINIICQTCDGFKIGEKDLEIRGPGEILGTRQSGELEFKAGDIIRDKDVLKWAVEDRDYLVNKDFFLTQPEHAALKRRLIELYQKKWPLIDLG